VRPACLPGGQPGQPEMLKLTEQKLKLKQTKAEKLKR